MEEKNYNFNMEDVTASQDYSLDDILNEYRSGLEELSRYEEKLPESRPLVLSSDGDFGGHSSISSLDQMMEEGTEEAENKHSGETENEFSGAWEDTSHAPAESERTISEYELRALVDSDEREAYASADIDFELGDEENSGEEYGGDEPPVAKRDPKRRRKHKPSGKRELLSPLVALLALMTNKRSVRVKADAELPTADDEDANIPEMPAEKAVKLYSRQLKSLLFRARVSIAVSIVMLYITFAAYSFLPLFGALKGPVGASLTLMIMLLTVMVCGLDVLAAGILNLVRLRPGYETLVALSCIFALGDAAAIAAMRTADFGLPFCAISAISMSLCILGNYFCCKGLRYGFKVAGSKTALCVTSEQGISGKGSAMFKSGRGVKGFIRRSEESDAGEYVFGTLAPIIIVAALIFSLLAAFVQKQGDSFIHCLSAMLACSAVFSGGLCFAHPFAVTAQKLYSSGGAICGWGGVRDIGKSRGVIITDGDIFPGDSVSVSSIRVLQNVSSDKVISYTGSVIAASGNGLAPSFTELIRRNGYSLCRVENFTPHEGGGLTAVVNGENLMVGNSGFMNLMGIRVPQKMANRNTIFTAISGELCGLFDIDYKPLPSVQDALGELLRSGSEAVFALRDFNMTPDALRNKFHVSGDGFSLPSYPERYRISGIVPAEDNPISAVIAREGMVPVVEVSKRGRRLYYCIMAASGLAAVGSVLGLLLMFFACWAGQFMWAHAAKAALIMLLWLIPHVLMDLWLRR